MVPPFPLGYMMMLPMKRPIVIPIATSTTLKATLNDALFEKLPMLLVFAVISLAVKTTLLFFENVPFDAILDVLVLLLCVSELAAAIPETREPASKGEEGSKA